MKLRSSLLATTAIAASLIVAGCGDDDEPQPATSDTSGATGATGATGTSGPLSKSEFATAADAICKEGEKSGIEAIMELFPDLQNLNDLSSEDLDKLATEVVAPNIQSQLDQIRELTPPEGDEDAVDAITSALEDGISDIEDDPSLLAVEGSGAAMKEASKLAAAYGLEECGR